jgi:hypothetical protein
MMWSKIGFWSDFEPYFVDMVKDGYRASTSQENLE